MPIHPSSPVPELFTHQPPPRADGRLPITITHLAITPADWTRRGRAPEFAISIEHVASPTAAGYRDLYDRVGRPWLWYERRLLGDQALQALLALPYIGCRVGPWLLDRAIERAFGRGTPRLAVNTNTLDHPRALDTYRKAGFRVVRSEAAELRDPRVLWPDLYRWPPN